MYLTVPIAIFGWPLVVLGLFLTVSVRTAIICSILGAWMFLPMAEYDVQGLPDVNKLSITSISVMACLLAFQSSAFASIKWKWSDLFMVVWILVPIASSSINGFGIYEGLSLTQEQIVAWGFPYLIGRSQFNTLESLRDLSFALFIAGLVYAPLVLFEMRMSPQLHTWVYGYHQHDFSQSRKGDGWRPTVFMQHGLAVAMFMATSSISGLWLWFSKGKKFAFGLPFAYFSVPLFLISASVRSSYALLLQIVAVGAMGALRFVRTRFFLFLLVSISPTYLIARTVVGWNAQQLRDAAESMGTDRARSLGVRLSSEDKILSWNKGRKWFGACNYSQLLIDSKKTGDQFIPDALWVIAYGKYGYVGLISLFGSLLAGPFLYFLRNSAHAMAAPYAAGATALAVVVTLHACDNLQNAMINPIYMLVAGGLISLPPLTRLLVLNVSPVDGGQSVVRAPA